MQQLGNHFHAFLLCTDGFWEYVLEEEMEIDLTKSNTPSEWISFMTQRLAKKVNGKNDNFTAGAVFTIK
jgi:serine/threonine protein phosphatase PrpC